MRQLSAPRRFAPRAEATRQARGFIEERLRTAHLEALVEDVGLLLAEVTANAVLHARTDFEVRLYELAAGVRVEVHDSSSLPPVCTAAQTSAMSGRGLLMVQALAARWGSDPDPGGGKSVWFEVGTSPLAAGPVTATADELLAMWADPDEPGDLLVDVPGDAAAVVVPDLPAHKLLAAKEHMEDLLREIQLMLLNPLRQSEGPEVSRCVVVAEHLDAAARAFAHGRQQVREQVSQAVRRGQELVTLRLHLPSSAARDALRYRDALEEAEQLGHAGHLLAAADALSRHRPVHRRYLNQVIDQLRSGGHR